MGMKCRLSKRLTYLECRTQRKDPKSFVLPLQCIGSHLTPEDLLWCRSVCRNWRHDVSLLVDSAVAIPTILLNQPAQQLPASSSHPATRPSRRRHQHTESPPTTPADSADPSSSSPGDAESLQSPTTTSTPNSSGSSSGEVSNSSGDVSNSSNSSSSGNVSNSSNSSSSGNVSNSSSSGDVSNKSSSSSATGQVAAPGPQVLPSALTRAFPYLEVVYIDVSTPQQMEGAARVMEQIMRPTNSSSSSGSGSSTTRSIALELDAMPRSYHCHQVSLG